MSETTRRKKATKKTVTKKTPVKKAAAKKKSEFSLADISTDLKKFEQTILTDDKHLDAAPYRIPFRNLGLQKITGGIIGGKFCEIAAISQCGKSFLGYELVSECQKMGGVANINDGERALEHSYCEMVGIDTSAGTMSVTSMVQMSEIFAYWTKLVTAVRKKKRNIPILLIQDSYPAMSIPSALDTMGSADTMGYEAMQKNQAWSREIEKFVPFLDKNAATLVLINQFTKDSEAGMYQFKYKSLCEEKMQYWATQRIRGVLRGPVKKVITVDGKEQKVQTGAVSEWETIKNRAVKPFQKVSTKIMYSKGMLRCSGLFALLQVDGFFTLGTSKKVEGETLDKAVKVARINKAKIADAEDTAFRLVQKDKKWVIPDERLEQLVEKYPQMLEPIWTGSYEDEETDMEPIGDDE